MSLSFLLGSGCAEPVTLPVNSTDLDCYSNPAECLSTVIANLPDSNSPEQLKPIDQKPSPIATQASVLPITRLSPQPPQTIPPPEPTPAPYKTLPTPAAPLKVKAPVTAIERQPATVNYEQCQALVDKVSARIAPPPSSSIRCVPGIHSRAGERLTGLTLSDSTVEIYFSERTREVVMFTVAHEIAHLWQQHLKTYEWTTIAELEREADHFAALFGFDFHVSRGNAADGAIVCMYFSSRSNGVLVC